MKKIIRKKKRNLLSKNDCIKLADFGLAYQSGGSMSSNFGEKGSIRYMSPEMFKGGMTRENQPKSDVW